MKTWPRSGWIFNLQLNARRIKSCRWTQPKWETNITVLVNVLIALFVKSSTVKYIIALHCGKIYHFMFYECASCLFFITDSWKARVDILVWYIAKELTSCQLSITTDKQMHVVKLVKRSFATKFLTSTRGQGYLSHGIWSIPKHTYLNLWLAHTNYGK